MQTAATPNGIYSSSSHYYDSAGIAGSWHHLVVASYPAHPYAIPKYNKSGETMGNTRTDDGNIHQASSLTIGDLFRQAV
ncbi:MAG: hypothetical protein ACRYG8_37310, partial [Janthinobacterium lividum]